ncbi:Stk1 family PASTA domain-containing Ser/Thr kinase [Actinocrispum sp. NPDC049592]|uniref:Stk1 family PASTA domain-containing Ser/Thr kinase n=1 Tax=Actinocrispum sp. NPDC049592 TaxID=3154835 RepID=UPI00342E8239
MATLLEQRYRVDAPLARGGMSAVYRGMDMRLERPVAIKVMDERFAEDRSFVDRFEREARAAASLHHPNVIAVHDQGFDGDHVFLVMELVDGGTLRDLLTERGRLPVPLALSVLEPVLSALAAAHQAGLVHRDVKPENVLIGRQGTVKVGDFGLVKAMASAGTTSNSVILGTVAYLSPEQVTTGATTASGDVYSAGVLLYEMLTGNPPYAGDTPISVAWQHVNDDVPAPSRSVPGIPPALDELVLRATRRDPSVRPPDAAAFLNELQRVRGIIGAPKVPIPHSAHGQTTMPGTEFPTVQTTPAAVPGGYNGTKAMLRQPDVTSPPTGVPIPPPPPAQPPRRPKASSPPPKKKPAKRIPMWAIVAAVLVVLAGLGFWMLSGTEKVKIPVVAGTSSANATEALKDAGLAAQIQKQRNDNVPKDKVISSTPAAGGEVAKGSTVVLIVSVGPPVVPQFEPGATEDTVRKAIEEQGLKAVRDQSSDNFDDNVAKGTVLGVSPSPGTQLKSGDSVGIFLSKGPAPLQPIPDVRGKTENDARNALRAAGYSDIQTQTTFDRSIDGGKVISTDPSAGSTPQDKRVTLLISNAVTVPELRGKRVNEARDQIKGLGLQLDVVGVFGGRGNRDDDDKRIAFQGPPAGTKVQKGSTVQVAVGFF